MVGGLSAINAVAGAYSDDLPLLLISGKTSHFLFHLNLLPWVDRVPYSPKIIAVFQYSIVVGMLFTKYPYTIYDKQYR